MLLLCCSSVSILPRDFCWGGWVDKVDSNHHNSQPTTHNPQLTTYNQPHLYNASLQQMATTIPLLVNRHGADEFELEWTPAFKTRFEELFGRCCVQLDCRDPFTPKGPRGGWYGVYDSREYAVIRMDPDYHRVLNELGLEASIEHVGEEGERDGCSRVVDPVIVQVPVLFKQYVTLRIGGGSGPCGVDPYDIPEIDTAGYLEALIARSLQVGGDGLSEALEQYRLANACWKKEMKTFVDEMWDTP